MSVTGKLAAWFHEQKDASVSFFLSRALQKELERYGRIVDLAVDSRQNTAQLEILLKGESETVTVFVEKYFTKISSEVLIWMNRLP